MNRNKTLSFEKPEHLQKARKDQRKPEVIYNFYKKLKEVVQARWTSPKAYPGTVYSVSTNGWMEGAQFFNWFESVFVKWVEDLRVKKNLPEQNALLLYDGHKSHIRIFPVNAEKFSENEFNPTDLKRFREQQRKAAENDGIRQGEYTDVEPEKNDTEEAGVEQLQSIPSTSACSNTNCITEASDIVAVFSSAIVETLNVDSNKYSAEPKKVTPRLKQARYGEVLTTAEVVERLKEAERQKEEKTTRKNRPRLENNSNEKQKRKRKEDSESGEENKVVSYDENSDGELNQDEWAEGVVDETYPEVEYTLPEWHLILPGIHSLVKFRGGSRNSLTYKYVCRVRDVDEETGDIEVVGFRRNDRLGAEYVEKEIDTSSIEFGMIEALLPNPKTSIGERKIIHIFPRSVNVFEK
ncbi:hypothetical protein JTB14_030453 [Gonioctena quinquepunctata]|nr:hypothetical protein JTB14_030453 [Gonioctena quinquepunctata]